jgi:hypothetical protein
MEHSALILGYVDPGSGLMVMQLIMAAVAGVLWSLRRFRKWVVGLFVRKPVETQKEAAEPAESPTKPC